MKRNGHLKLGMKKEDNTAAWSAQWSGIFHFGREQVFERRGKERHKGIYLNLTSFYPKINDCNRFQAFEEVKENQDKEREDHLREVIFKLLYS